MTAEPLLGRTRVRLPYGLDGKMWTQNDAIGQVWAKNSFATSEPGFNDLVAKLKMTPNVGTYELPIRRNWTVLHNLSERNLSHSNVFQ